MNLIHKWICKAAGFFDNRNFSKWHLEINLGHNRSSIAPDSSSLKKTEQRESIPAQKHGICLPGVLYDLWSWFREC